MYNSVSNLCYVSMLYYGIVLYGSFLILISILSIGKWTLSDASPNPFSSVSLYVQVEVNKSISNSNNVNLYWILSNCSIIIILTTLSHIIVKIGIFNSISYNICYWLIGTGLGFYITPFIVYFYRMLIYIINYSVYRLSISSHSIGNIYDCSYSYVKLISSGSNYNSGYIFGIIDISSVMNVYRGLNNVMNWLYQMIYYGVRLWLVFVLHSFSLGCFGELITVISDNNMILNVVYFGLLGLGIMLFLLVVFYLSIQIYVYISFSLSFLHSTILLLFYLPIYPTVSHSSHSSPTSYNSTYTNSAQSYLFNVAFIGLSYMLIPVSIVDILSFSILVYILVLYVIFVICIPIILSNINITFTYHYIYTNLLI